MDGVGEDAHLVVGGAAAEFDGVALRGALDEDREALADVGAVAFEAEAVWRAMISFRRRVLTSRGTSSG